MLLTLHDMDLHLPQGTTGPDLAQVWQQTPDPAAIVAQYDAGLAHYNDRLAPLTSRPYSPRGFFSNITIRSATSCGSPA